MEDRDIARLLSGRNEPSVLEKEADFEQVMDVVTREQRKQRRGWLWGLAGAVAAACVAVALIPRDGPGADEFAARGGGGSSSFVLACLAPDGSSRCVTGGKLAFDLSAPEDLYFAAFAQRPDGTVLWYWPTPTGGSQPVASFSGKQAFHTAVMLDQSHPPGNYGVYGVFSKTSLTRDALKRALGDDLRGDGSVVVLRRSLTIEAQ